MTQAPLLSLVWDNDVTPEQIADAGGWQALGACAPGQLDSDPDVMFPDTKGDPRAKASKKVCAGCPWAVKKACLEENWGERYGTYGGMTEWERKAAKNRLRQQRFRDKQAAHAESA